MGVFSGLERDIVSSFEWMPVYSITVIIRADFGPGATGSCLGEAGEHGRT